MSTKRSSKKSTAATTTAKAERRSLNAEEEKVVRMRSGLKAPDELPLGRVGQTHPATRAKLRELEQRAFEKSGRLDELRRDVGLPATKTDGAVKEKIISKLKKKASKKKVAAPAAKTKPSKTTKEKRR